MWYVWRVCCTFCVGCMQLRVSCLLYNRVLVLNILKQTLSSFTVSRHKQVEFTVFAAWQIVILLTQILMTGNCCYASLPCVDSAQKCLLAVVSWTLQPQSTLHTQKQCSALVQIHTECTDTKCTVEWQCWHCLRHCLPSPSQCTFKTFSGIFVPRVGPGQVSK